MSAWTHDEAKAIRALKRAFSRKPETVRLYEIDGRITACRQGTPSSDLCEEIGRDVYAGCVLTDMHDDDVTAMTPPEAQADAPRTQDAGGDDGR